MPVTVRNLTAPRRGFYARRIPASQLHQLEQMSADVSHEIHILRLKVKALLDMLEGLTFYTDLDLHKLAMINTLVGTIGRLVQRNRLLTSKDLDLRLLLESTVQEDAGQWES
jgi:hypothetical protein